MKTISQDDRAQLVALLGLAAVYRGQLEETVTAIYRIVGGESDLAGYVGDEVWGATDYGADELLRRLAIEVTP